MSKRVDLSEPPTFKTNVKTATALTHFFHVLDKGHVELIASAASDISVVNAARVSFNSEEATMTEKNEGLIKYLMRERHGTPFEHGYFRFRVKAPLFVFREWHRHRAGHSYNEWSARYSELKPEWYVPRIEDVVEQHGKPGNYEFARLQDEIDARSFIEELEQTSREAFSKYEFAISLGIAKQQARLFLPVNTYSEMIWSCNPRSLMHFLSLRNSEQAQWEIRQYAQVVEAVFLDKMPVTAKAFIDSGRVAP